MLLHHDAFIFQDGTCRVRGLGSFHNPIQRTIKVEIDGGGVGVGVVLAQVLDVFTIALSACVCCDDREDGTTFAAADDLVGRADRIMFSSAGRSMLAFWTWRSDRFFKAIE